jgi:uncharacterized repeat protein (TIGR03806 family)
LHILGRLRASAVLLLVAAGIYACGADSVPKALSVEVASGLTTCRPPFAPPAFRLTDVLPGVTFDRPVTVTRQGSTWFVAEQGGHVRRVMHDGVQWMSDLFLDVTDDMVPPQGESGLLGFAVSPDFATSGEVFVSYTGRSATPPFRAVVARLASRDGGLTADPTSRELVLAIDRDLEGHNGGHLLFGPDRHLYIGVGDGSWGDPLRRAQDPAELFGKILRLDVLGGRPYVTPPDNPFSGATGRPEVYALGFRNPWSFSFDEVGRLWVGDVGHDRWEEINLVTKGGNYGWPVREGRHCFGQAPCDVPGAIDPVHAYAHVDGFSVTGGVVYRGKGAALAGAYVFGDFMTGRIWALDAAEPGASRLLVDSALNISGFAEDENGEVLVIDYGGHVFRLEASEVVTPVASTLAGLDCLDPERNGELAHGLTPYEVNAPLWSDGLDKRRWFSLPKGHAIHVADDGTLEAPRGTLVLKEFSSRGRRIETRMLVRDETFGWLGYTFEWNEDQTDAVLIDEAKTVDVDGSPWTLPSRGQCFACHRKSAGGLLGFEIAQLNRTVVAGQGERVNQLAELARLGLLDKPIDPSVAPSFPDPYDVTVAVEPRARAYLHANCSFCHGAAGTPQGLIDLRAAVPADEMNVLCRAVSFGGLEDSLEPQTVLVLPGEPNKSLLVGRMGALDGPRMPPLGSGRVDRVALDVVSSWIASLSGCP